MRSRNFPKVCVSRWAWDQRHDGEQHLCFLLWFTPVNRYGRSTSHLPLWQVWRFKFPYYKLSFLGSNIRSSPVYRVFISQLIRYARACSSYECFILRAVRLTNKLRGQEYVKECLRVSLRKFYGRYRDLIKQYEPPPLPNVTRHSRWWPSTVTPSIDQALYQCLNLLLVWTLLQNLTFYLIARGFHRTFATGAACQQMTPSPPETWSCPTLGLASVLMLRPISPELVLFPDFEFRASLGTSVLLNGHLLQIFVTIGKVLF